MEKTSAEVKEELKPRIAYLTEQGCQPGVAVVLVGDDPASQIYVRNKEEPVKNWAFIPFSIVFLPPLLKKS